MTEPDIARRWLVQGVVQGVGFRWFVARQAARLTVVGWVRNLPDGRVEVVARGTRAALDDLDAALRRGPAHARVENVEKSEIRIEVVTAKSFEIR